MTGLAWRRAVAGAAALISCAAMLSAEPRDVSHLRKPMADTVHKGRWGRPA